FERVEMNNPALDIYPIDHAEHLTEAGTSESAPTHSLEGPPPSVEQSDLTDSHAKTPDIHARIHALEQLLNMQIIATRQDFTREANERRELFAQLAAKFSRNLERLEEKCVALEEKHRLSEKQLQNSLIKEIEQTRKEIKSTAAKLSGLTHTRR
ncbi:MAG: hypothetical protein AAF591_11610, partial [Verrucomicrobiota bacterium]